MKKFKTLHLAISILLLATINCYASSDKNKTMMVVEFKTIDWTAKIITSKKTEELKIKNNQDNWIFENENMICRIFKENKHTISNINAITRQVSCALIREKLIITTQVICDPFGMTCSGNLEISDKDNNKILQMLILGTKKN